MPNTITLPEDTAGANQKLDELLVPEKSVYLFIFGNTAKINDFAKAADGEVGGALRLVVRRSKCDDLLPRFQALKIDPDAGDLNSPDMVGFSTSGKLVIADVILSTDELNALRASDAFIAAEGQV